MSTNDTLTRLPLAHLPAAVLPGATVTLTLASSELRRAFDAAVADAAGGGRILLTAADEHRLGVVARVPSVGDLPSGESAAIVQIVGRARIVATHADGGRPPSAARDNHAVPPTGASCPSAGCSRARRRRRGSRWS